MKCVLQYFNKSGKKLSHVGRTSVFLDLSISLLNSGLYVHPKYHMMESNKINMSKVEHIDDIAISISQM